MSPRRVLSYLRVSGQEQGKRGTSLDGQQALVRSFCSMRGWPEPEIYVEVESAGAEKIERRSELQRLIKEAKAGDLVLVCAVDRWSRDIVFAVKSVRDLIARKVGWFSINENLDASTPQGDSTLGIMAWVADQERQRIKARTVGRKNELRAEGKFVEGKVSFGYRRAGRTLEIVEEEAAIVREIYRLCIGGWSVREIAEEISATTGTAWGPWRVYWVLTNRIYLGEISTPDGSHTTPRTHPAIIDHATFDRAQVALARRKTGGRRQGDPQARTRNWLMFGLAVCAACGGHVGAAYGNGIDYYACAARKAKRGCSAPYVRVDAADAEASRLIEAHLTELRHALARHGSPARERATSRQSVAVRRDRLDGQLRRATQLAVEGAITAAELRTQRERIERELAALAAEEEQAVRAAKRATPSARRALLEQVEILRAAWARLSVQDRHRVLRLLALEVHLAAGKAPEFVWRTTEELAEEVGRDEASV